MTEKLPETIPQTQGEQKYILNKKALNQRFFKVILLLFLSSSLLGPIRRIFYYHPDRD